MRDNFSGDFFNVGCKKVGGLGPLAPPCSDAYAYITVIIKHIHDAILFVNTTQVLWLTIICVLSCRD